MGRVFRIGVARVERQANRASPRTSRQGTNAEGRIVTIDNCAVEEINHLIVGDRIDEFPRRNFASARRTYFRKLTQRGGRANLIALQETAKKLSEHLP
jgi:hypothetical protein